MALTEQIGLSSEKYWEQDLGTSTMNTVSLFTTFAPFRRRAPGPRRCAVVTREKRLLILDADGDDTAQDIQVRIPVDCLVGVKEYGEESIQKRGL